MYLVYAPIWTVHEKHSAGYSSQYRPRHGSGVQMFSFYSANQLISSAGIFKQYMGARNQVGIGLSYQPARLHSLVELVPWNRFLGFLKFKNSGSGRPRSTPHRTMIESPAFGINHFIYRSSGPLRLSCKVLERGRHQEIVQHCKMKQDALELQRQGLANTTEEMCIFFNFQYSNSDLKKLVTR